jgi:hypothetical protein
MKFLLRYCYCITAYFEANANIHLLNDFLPKQKEKLGKGQNYKNQNVENQKELQKPC